MEIPLLSIVKWKSLETLLTENIMKTMSLTLQKEVISVLEVGDIVGINPQL